MEKDCDKEKEEREEFIKEFIEDIFGISEYDQSSAQYWMQELAELVYCRDYRKNK
jgi:hypothetical protein